LQADSYKSRFRSEKHYKTLQSQSFKRTKDFDTKIEWQLKQVSKEAKQKQKIPFTLYDILSKLSKGVLQE